MERGQDLIDRLGEAERGLCAWLLDLAAFDAEGGWAADGQLSCVEWLRFKARMARATAYEKLSVGRALRRAPALARALGSGRISYSGARLIARTEDAWPETLDALIDLAEAGTLADLERAVGHYRALAEQERPPADPRALRSVRLRPGPETGFAVLECTLTVLEAAEVMALLDATVLGERPGATDEDDPEEAPVSAAADSGGAEPEGADREAPGQQVPFSSRRAEALLELVRAGYGRGDAPALPERHLVHVVVRPGEPVSLLDGTPLHPSDTATLACDAPVVAHHHGEGGAPLYLGRKRRSWSVAQRRAIWVRDRGTCRFPGCERHSADVHHVTWWEHGGGTDVDNGILACPRHHSLLHAGFDASGDANGRLSFYRRDGTVLAEG